MLKPTSSYKMSKPTKTSLALSKWKSDEQRHQWKRAMIQAELASKLVVKPSKKERTSGNYNIGSNSATSNDV